MPKLATLFLILAAAGCSSDKKDAPAATPSGAKAGTAKPSAPKPAAPSAKQLTCDKIFSQALRDAYFKDAKITDQPQPTEFSAQCDIADGSPAGAVVAASCHENVAAAMTPTIEGMKKNMDITELEGVGKGAIVVEMGAAGKVISAWDDDSDCHVTLTIPAAIDAVKFAKDVLAGLPVK